jgi:23S rRNA (cytosine1962-C5)-methyltransferase
MLSLTLQKDSAKQVRAGYPWAFAGDIRITSDLETALPGSLVRISDHDGKPLGVGYYNPKAALACRVLSLNPNAAVDVPFFRFLFVRALERREKLFSLPFYRLAHSESDGLPGLVVDRFGDVLVCQTGTAGMEALKPLWIEALRDVVRPSALVFRDDAPARAREGLGLSVSFDSPVPPLAEVRENGCVYYADLLAGQKTGWFYDQRANRRYVAELSQGKTMLDLYSHSGGFGLACAKGGAARTTLVDSSALALDLAARAAGANGVAESCEFVRADVYVWLEEAAKAGRRFDVVMADPPAFVKERKHKAAGLKGYKKLASLCAPLVAEDGAFCIASCSHHAPMREFRRAVEEGITAAGRRFSLVKQAGADKDHPVRPLLPESGYLKFSGYRSDAGDCAAS